MNGQPSNRRIPDNVGERDTKSMKNKVQICKEDIILIKSREKKTH